ncbi:hypothetical protein SOCE26_105090 [Sorangium cellulosum]|uniref:Methyltransferase domain-containing protein n=1 Tax=Sorangium cellulosum TaxID=56 RepID=A0A2L0FBN1_SORCE|nr:class I SAM-dependent methyltransferase [Sorangium cellulosum]AUX48964.1 hypothetical protein SOCE26_105090 [Sorangium cellulosum]
MTMRAPAGYEADQRRDDLSAYARYLAAMDASMRQKVALTAAHLLCEGRVADMGMGSGQGSVALAQLYPRLEVIGVDIDPTVVELARRAHRHPNLSFQLGDIAAAVFPPESLDGIFDSSVLHHVTSYGGYRHANAADALAAQVEQLSPDGVLVVRDFVDPGPGQVLLDVPADDGEGGRDPRTASTAALLERFAGEFRSLSPEPGFPLVRVEDGPSGVPAPRPGWRRYQLAHKHAAEFVLRKDYRADWEAEVKEEYTYFSQAQFEALFARLGLRVLSSTPLRNPWIVRNRFAGRFELRDAAGARLPYPPTNYLIVGEKVKAGQGVAFRLRPAESPQQFLRIEHHLDRATGQVFDLAARPHPTLDIVPFFFAGSAGETAYVLARTSYPRPIAHACREETPPLDGSGPADYLAEPIAVVQTEFPVGHTVERALERAAGVPAAAIQRMIPGTTYYPSPGGILEEVRSMLVEVEPTFVNAPSDNVSGFGTSGRIRAIEARQLLRAAQVGGLPDARLELNVYDLLARFGLPFGPWIGDDIPLASAGAGRSGSGAAAVGDNDEAAAVVQPTSLGALLARPSRRRFSRVDRSASAGFLEVRRARFEELSAAGDVVAARELEYVVPRPLGALTVATALLARSPSGEVLLGVDDDDLPAAQSFSGNSEILVAPAWRLPRSEGTLAAAEAFVRLRLQVDYGVRVGGAVELGGAYRPSAGLTPELVQPLAFVITAAAAETPAPDAAAPDLEPPSGAVRRLSWVPLTELVAGREHLPDGHLRVVALRAAHALGVAIAPPRPR